MKNNCLQGHGHDKNDSVDAMSSAIRFLPPQEETVSGCHENDASWNDRLAPTVALKAIDH